MAYEYSTRSRGNEVRLYEFTNSNISNRNAIRAFIDAHHDTIDASFWNDEDAMFLVLVLLPSTIIGAAVLSPYDNKQRVHLHVIFVDTAWRRRGLGTELLKHAVRMHPDKEITLSVTFDNLHVLNFYYGHGYAKLKQADAASGLLVLSLLHDKLR